MLLPVFLAFCIGLATSIHVNEIQPSEPVETKFVADDLCGCSKEPLPQCGCCYDFEFEEKKHNICVNMTYIKDVKGLRLTVIMDGKVLVNKTLSAKNPPPFCQGIKPFAYICEKYSNMSYGDDKKWGGCLEIYGGVVVQILDVKFGCFYLPVDTQEINKKITDKLTPPSLANRFMDLLKKTLVEKMQQWHGRKFGKRRSGRHHKGKKGSLRNILFKNRVDDGDNQDIEIPDIY